MASKKFVVNPVKDKPKTSASKLPAAAKDPLGPQEIQETYSGIECETQFIGADNIPKGVLASTFLSTLRTTRASTVKINVDLKLCLKGLILLEEISQSFSCVKLTKVKNICSDADDSRYFGVSIVVNDSNSQKQYRLYAFEAANQATSADFISSAREVVAYVQRQAMGNHEKAEIDGLRVEQSTTEETSVATQDPEAADEESNGVEGEASKNYELENVKMQLEKVSILKEIFQKLEEDSDQNFDHLLDKLKKL